MKNRRPPTHGWSHHPLRPDGHLMEGHPGITLEDFSKSICRCRKRLEGDNPGPWRPSLSPPRQTARGWHRYRPHRHIRPEHLPVFGPRQHPVSNQCPQQISGPQHLCQFVKPGQEKLKIHDSVSQPPLGGRLFDQSSVNLRHWSTMRGQA